jgi:arylsulfatase A-like enzyme
MLKKVAGMSLEYNFGKWHMGSQSGPRPGFDVSASFVGQGRYQDRPFEVNGKMTPSQGWIDDVSTEYALAYLRENKGRPFALTVGYKAAHGPFEPPERHRSDYSGVMARSVPNLATPAIYRAKGVPPPSEVPREVKVNPGYFACLTAMDDNVGRLLKELDDLGLAANTVVVFAGDNGYYLGEHGLGDKRSAYDESLRIPLLLRYPKLVPTGRIVDEMVLNTDLASTILDLAGVPRPATLQGRSWRPLLEGRPGDWRQAYFYAYFFERGFDGIPTVTAVRTEKAKLIRYPGHDEWTEVFDLTADPYETRNLATDPTAASLRQSLELEYARQALEVGFAIPAFADQPGQSASGAKPLNAWVLEYRFDRDEGDKVVDTSGHGNHGQAQGCPRVDGRAGRQARRFDGKGLIEVPKSASLDPSIGAWTIEVGFKAEAPTGVILARGGRTHGYCLHLNEGRPVFTVTGSNTASSVSAAEVVTGTWATLQARITAAGELRLSLNGAPPARARLASPIAADPNDTMQIGGDRNSPVAAAASASGFVGLIESVRLFSGADGSGQ